MKPDEIIFLFHEIMENLESLLFWINSFVFYLPFASRLMKTDDAMTI